MGEQQVLLPTTRAGGTGFLWQGRLCKIIKEAGTPAFFVMSAVGEHGNFDFAPPRTHAGQAVAGSLPGDVVGQWPNLEMVGCREPVEMTRLDDAHLHFTAGDGTFWLLTGNPMGEGRFFQLARDYR